MYMQTYSLSKQVHISEKKPATLEPFIKINLQLKENASI